METEKDVKNMDIKAEKCVAFVRHIEDHLVKMGKENVICKICGKTIDEIWNAETKKDHHLFIQPGIYEENKTYIDRNGMPFHVNSGRITIEETNK